MPETVSVMPVRELTHFNSLWAGIGDAGGEELAGVRNGKTPVGEA